MEGSLVLASSLQLTVLGGIGHAGADSKVQHIISHHSRAVSLMQGHS